MLHKMHPIHCKAAGKLHIFVLHLTYIYTSLKGMVLLLFFFFFEKKSKIIVIHSCMQLHTLRSPYTCILFCPWQNSLITHFPSMATTYWRLLHFPSLSLVISKYPPSHSYVTSPVSLVCPTFLLFLVDSPSLSLSFTVSFSLTTLCFLVHVRYPSISSAIRQLSLSFHHTLTSCLAHGYFF